VAGALPEAEGVVLPVAEQVFKQLRAAQVLDVSRARARSPQDGQKVAETGMAHLRAYAVKLGPEHISELEEVQTLSAAPPGSPAVKMAMAAAHSVQRAAKDFKKKG
jgi:hypothetical protein